MGWGGYCGSIFLPDYFDSASRTHYTLTLAEVCQLLRFFDPAFPHLRRAIVDDVVEAGELVGGVVVVVAEGGVDLLGGEGMHESGRNVL